MPDQVNDILAFTLINFIFGASITINTNGVDLSFFEQGVTIAWSITNQSSPSTSSLILTPQESSVSSTGPWVNIPQNRLFGSNFFESEFGKDKLFSSDKTTSSFDAISYFQILAPKRFIRAVLAATVQSSNDMQVIVNVFAYGELSPVIKSSIPFVLGSP